MKYVRVKGVVREGARNAAALLMACLLTVSLMPATAWADASVDEATTVETVSPSSIEEDAENQAVVEGEAELSAASDDDSASVGEALTTKSEPAITALSQEETFMAMQSAAVPAAQEESSVTAPAATSWVVRLSITHTQGDSANTPVASWVDTSLEVSVGSTVEQALDLAVSQNLIDSYMHGEAFAGFSSYYVKSMTIAQVTYADAADYSSFWSFLIDGSYAYTGINDTVVTDGMAVELRYVDGKVTGGATEGSVTVDPSVDHPNLSSDQASKPNNAGAVIEPIKTPSSPEQTELAWSQSLKAVEAEFANVSELLLVGGKVFVAVSSGSYATGATTGTLFVFDQATGLQVGKTPLVTAIDFACKPVYADGVIVVPLAGGRLQGIAADNLSTMWLTGEVTSGSQSISSLAAAHGSVFMGTLDAYDNNYQAAAGSLVCVDLLTGAMRWKNVNTQTGCYWSGIAACGSVLVYGDDAGMLSAVDAKTGTVLSQVALGASVRSSTTLDEAGSTAFVGTVDGRVHRISLTPDGQLAQEGSVVVGSTSSSTPTLFEGNLYIGAANLDYTGALVVVNATTMQVVARIATLADGSTLPGNVQSMPLVGKDSNGNVLAYFTCNAQPGGVYVYRLGDANAQSLFIPQGTDANWCMKSIVMGADGSLYYTNDSGTLFALKAKASEKPDTAPSDDSSADKEDSSETDSDTKQQSGQQAPLARSPLTTSVAAAKAPLAQVAATSTLQTEAGARTSSASSRETLTTAATEGVHDNSSAAEQDSAGVNPWAVGGIVAGFVGLAGIGAYLAFARRPSFGNGKKGN